MSAESTVAEARPAGGEAARAQLLEGIDVEERRDEFAGVSTAWLEGGSGPPLVLLHGPGEFAGKWFRVLPALLERHRVIAPDLPDHGNSRAAAGPLDLDGALAWLGSLVEGRCAGRPRLVGHVLGGALAARFAIRRPGRVAHLVLVDTLGLARFRPDPRFALRMLAFLRKPTERRFESFMRQCSHDLDGLREEMGDDWEPFSAYNVERAASPQSKAVSSMLREFGLPPIPPAELAAIEAPTSLIWGRNDRANRLRIAERASQRYGWPLHVVDECADDPPRDRPAEFVAALEQALTAAPAGG